MTEDQKRRDTLARLTGGLAEFTEAQFKFQSPEKSHLHWNAEEGQPILRESLAAMDAEMKKVNVEKRRVVDENPDLFP